MIYDTFIFFNELELLEVRLHELSEVVDKFVLVEALRTFTNKPKPLHFYENRTRFSSFADKIIYVVVEDSPDYTDPWVIERFQRNCIIRGLVGCRPDDLIMISDADEIPRAATVRQLQSQLRYTNGIATRFTHGAVKAIAAIKPLRKEFRKFNPYVWKLEQTWYYYFLNCRPACANPWYGTRAVYYRDLTIAEEIRHSGYHIIRDGGWHFAWMGGVERVRQKISSFAHQEINKPEFTDPEQVKARMSNDVLPVPLDTTFPEYIRAQQDKFSGWIKPL